MVRLSEILGRRVVDSDGRSLGRVSDLVVRLDPAPRVVRLRIRGQRRRVEDVSWQAVSALAGPDFRLAPEVKLRRAALAEHELLLARHVLDAQIVDLTGRCLTRVGDVQLSTKDGTLRTPSILAVEVGPQPLLRRLGLHFLARRARCAVLEWTDLHLTSYRGRSIQLATGKAAAAVAPVPSHSELLESLAPTAARRRFRFRWMRRRAAA